MQFDYEGIALIPVITVLVNLIKKIGISNRILPAISIVIGIIFGVIFYGEGDLKKGILAGLVMGMSASGLYSNGRSVLYGAERISRK